jgi:DNA-binding NarL/FixJ family response regulator
MLAGGDSRYVPSEPNGLDRAAQLILFGVVDAISQGVERDFEVLRCRDAACLAELREHTKTSVLLVDLEFLSDSNRSQLVKHLGRLNAPLAVAFSDSADDQSCEQLLGMGFVGVLRRDTSQEMLGRAIFAVLDGQLWFPRLTLSRLLKGFLIRTVNRLTAREMEILTLIGSGLSNQKIADRLFISRETVRWHLRSLYSKLGIKGRQGAKEYVDLLCGAGRPMPAKSVVKGDEWRHSRTAS